MDLHLGDKCTNMNSTWEFGFHSATFPNHTIIESYIAPKNTNSGSVVVNVIPFHPQSFLVV